MITIGRAGRWTTREFLEELFRRGCPAGAFWSVNLPHLAANDPEPELVFCHLDTQPLPVQFRRDGDCFIYAGDYHARPRDAGGGRGSLFRRVHRGLFTAPGTYARIVTIAPLRSRLAIPRADPQRGDGPTVAGPHQAGRSGQVGEAEMTRRWKHLTAIAALLTTAVAGRAQEGYPSPVGATRMLEPLRYVPGPQPNLVPGPVTPAIAPVGPPPSLSLPENHTSAFQCERTPPRRRVTPHWAGSN